MKRNKKDLIEKILMYTMAISCIVLILVNFTMDDDDVILQMLSDYSFVIWISSMVTIIFASITDIIIYIIKNRRK